VAALAAGIDAFCQRLQPTLENLSFAQRRQLVELIIDRVIINDGLVEIRYVIPIGPDGEKFRFCHLRTDYFSACHPPIGYAGREIVITGPVSFGMVTL
jgi:site-specific DNA recombinase